MTSVYSDWDLVPLTNPLEESAAILGLTRSQTYRLYRSGKLEGIKVSERKLLFTKAALRAFLQDEEKTPFADSVSSHGLNDLGAASRQEGRSDVC
jgi:excisionase family DNA binding protein